MTSRDARGVFVLTKAIVVALGCVALAGAGGTSGLSIATDPADASVYIDGRLAGASPVRLTDLSAGEHRVRVVKPGFLENARMVTLAAGQPKAIQITLTRATGTASAEQVVSHTAGSGGGSKKWLYIAAAGGGAVAATGFVLANRNHAPSAGTAAVSPTGTGIAAVTSFAFVSQGASDPDGDNLTLTWNFGDGGSATGTNVSHVFANAGTFNVNVTASDGKADARSADIPVTVRTVSASWVGTLQGITRTFTFTQSGSTVSGSYSRNAGGVVTPGTVTGTLNSARTITGVASSSAFAPFTFEGSFDTAVSVLTVTANGSGFTGETLTFTRQ